MFFIFVTKRVRNPYFCKNILYNLYVYFWFTDGIAYLPKLNIKRINYINSVSIFFIFFYFGISDFIFWCLDFYVVQLNVWLLIFNSIKCGLVKAYHVFFFLNKLITLQIWVSNGSDRTVRLREIRPIVRFSPLEIGQRIELGKTLYFFKTYGPTRVDLG